MKGYRIAIFGVLGMLVSGSLYADLFARTGTSGQQNETRSASVKNSPAAAPVGEAPRSDDRPAYFSMISTISPGSLAAAYQVIRAKETGDEGGASAQSRDPAILSGLGIPSALDAYGEVLESD